MLGLSPPEVISGQIYSGPGSGPLTAASAAWVNLSSELEQITTGYQSVLAGLGEVWQGASAAVMRTSGDRLVRWIEATAASAHQTGVLARSAASSYETVWAEVVPPAMIAANRAQLLLLIATNLLGQNSAAIAANEAQYAAYWAQDTAAMSAYTAGQQAATGNLPTFRPAPQVTAAVQPAVTAPLDNSDAIGLLEAGVLALGLPIELTALFTSFFGPFLGSSMIAAVNEQIAQEALAAPGIALPPTPAPGGTPLSGAPVATASAGSAGRVGKMSVPPSWSSRFEPPTTAAQLNTPAGGSSTKEKERAVGIPIIPAVPVTGGKATKRKKGSDPDDFDYGRPTPSILKRHPSGG